MNISIENPQRKFTEHLNQPSNDRIFFSGKFGTGKSYFLKEYFKGREDDYNLFWLSPINYVVGANQDIFEWIKIDIAKDLITKHFVGKEEESLSKNFLIQTYLYQNAGAIFEKLIKTLGNKITKKKTGIDILDTFKKHFDDYQKFEKNANSEFESHSSKLRSFLNEAFQASGSIYEDDLTTKIIRASITKIKYDSSKENILVIDDLDRLDPEHIFRILNILSAHNDHFDSNKFGVDKVILVCDYDNIHALYKYRYGTEADFEGYIEKFFTYIPFHFSINNAIIEYCSTLSDVEDLDDSNKKMLTLLMVLFYKYKLLKIRNLKKVVGKSIDKSLKLPTRQYPYTIDESTFVYVQSFIASKAFNVDYNKFAFIRVLYLLSLCFGGIKKLKTALASISSQGISFDIENIKYFTDSLFVLGHLSKHIPTNQQMAFYRKSSDDRNERLAITTPNANFFDKQVQIPLIWDHRTPYTEGHYFQIYNPSALAQHFLIEKRNDKHISFASLVQEINPILNLIVSEELFNAD